MAQRLHDLVQKKRSLKKDKRNRGIRYVITVHWGSPRRFGYFLAILITVCSVEVYATPQTIGPMFTNDDDEIVNGISYVNFGYTRSHGACGPAGPFACNPSASMIAIGGMDFKNGLDGAVGIVPVDAVEQIPDGVNLRQDAFPPGNNGRFGALLGNLGVDCNGNQVPEIYVSEPGCNRIHILDPSMFQTGSSVAYLDSLNAPGTVGCDGSGDAFGDAVDLYRNESGETFFIIGAPQASSQNKGKTYVFKFNESTCQFDTGLFLEFDGGIGSKITSNSKYGFSVANAGDVTGDGTPEIIVGAPWDRVPGDLARNGAAYVYDGAAVFDTENWGTAYAPDDSLFWIGPEVDCDPIGYIHERRCGWKVGPLGEIDPVNDGDYAFFVTAREETGESGESNAGAFHVYEKGTSGWDHIFSEIGGIQGGYLGDAAAALGDWEYSSTEDDEDNPDQLLAAVGEPGYKETAEAIGRVQFIIFRELAHYNYDDQGLPQFVGVSGGTRDGFANSEQGATIERVPSTFPNGSFGQASPLSGIMTCGPNDDDLGTYPNGYLAEPPQPQAIINSPTGSPRVAPRGLSCLNPASQHTSFGTITIVKSSLIIGNQLTVTNLNNDWEPGTKIVCGIGQPMQAGPTRPTELEYWGPLMLQGAGQWGNEDGLQEMWDGLPGYDWCGSPPCLEPDLPAPASSCKLGVDFEDFTLFDTVITVDDNGDFSEELPYTVTDGLVRAIQCFEAYDNGNGPFFTQASRTNRALFAGGI